MKNMRKWFTLVEMLIVVVIIWILSAALLPRLQWAQASARDTARKADIATLGTAIVSYFNQKWTYPEWTGWAYDMTWADSIWELLKKQVDLSSLPADPTKWNIVYWFAWVAVGTDMTTMNKEVKAWQYWYQVVTKNWVKSWWFILMARPETEWWANFSSGYKIKSWDISNFNACTSFEIWTVPTDKLVPSTGTCKYQTKSDLRYIYIF